MLVVQNKAAREYTHEEIEAAQAVATLLAEIAASGELLSQEETEAVGAMLHLPEKIKGFGIVSGIALGKAVFLQPPAPKHKVFAKNPAAEATRLEEGLTDLRQSVDDMLATNSLSGVSREVLETYRLFAYDRGWKDRLRAAVFSGLTAESAVEQVKSENRARLSQSRDPYLRERLHDLDDLSNRLLRHLAGDKSIGQRALYDETILFARTMGPAELLEYDRKRLKGLVLGEVSATSHVAIVARALKLPMVTGAPEAMELTEEGDHAVVDGDAGEIYIRPTADVQEDYRAKQSRYHDVQASYASEKSLPPVTKDGAAVAILMNAGLALDLPFLEQTGATGVGLFRTELQFLIGSQLPSVAMQEALYSEVLDLADGKSVIFRTADIGGDKTAPYMEHGNEANPAMGWRGVRMAVDRPGMIRPQMRALLSAAAGRTLWVMFPFLTLTGEVDEIRELLDREIDRAKRRGKALPVDIKVGAMIETTASAWRAALIAQKVDFLSIGGNDLAQFYFAADRDSERVQRRYDPMNAGFLSFLKATVDKVSRTGTPLSYCGEQTADPVTAAALLGIGVRQFSLPAAFVGPFRRLVRSIEAKAVSDWLDEHMMTPEVTLRPAFTQFLKDSGAVLE